MLLQNVKTQDKNHIYFKKTIIGYYDIVEKIYFLLMR